MTNWKSHIARLAFAAICAGSASAQAALISLSTSLTAGSSSTSFTISSTELGIPLTGPVSWSASVSGTLTDETGAPGGATATPLPSGGGFPASIFEFKIDGLTVGVDDLGAVTSASFSDSYGGSATCSTSCTMQAIIHFTASAFDSFSFSTTFTVESGSQGVPEPAVLPLIVLGLAGAAAAARRRKQ